MHIQDNKRGRKYDKKIAITIALLIAPLSTLTTLSAAEITSSAEELYIFEEIEKYHGYEVNEKYSYFVDVEDYVIEFTNGVLIEDIYSRMEYDLEDSFYSDVTEMLKYSGLSDDEEQTLMNIKNAYEMGLVVSDRVWDYGNEIISTFKEKRQARFIFNKYNESKVATSYEWNGSKFYRVDHYKYYKKRDKQWTPNGTTKCSYTRPIDVSSSTSWEKGERCGGYAVKKKYLYTQRDHTGYTYYDEDYRDDKVKLDDISKGISISGLKTVSSYLPFTNDVYTGDVRISFPIRSDMMGTEYYSVNITGFNEIKYTESNYSTLSSSFNYYDIGKTTISVQAKYKGYTSGVYSQSFEIESDIDGKIDEFRDKYCGTSKKGCWDPNITPKFQSDMESAGSSSEVDKLVKDYAYAMAAKSITAGNVVSITNLVLWNVGTGNSTIDKINSSCMDEIMRYLPSTLYDTIVHNIIAIEGMASASNGIYTYHSEDDIKGYLNDAYFEIAFGAYVYDSVLEEYRI